MSKKLLKEAREAIANKEYKTCLNLCQEILKEDESNYMANVFIGICYQEIGSLKEALNSFRKAIKLNASNILAYNGLANYYEKHGSAGDSTELLEVYNKIIDLDCNEKRILESVGKILKLCDVNVELIVKSVQDILINDNIEENIKDGVKILFSNFLTSYKNELPDDILVLHENLLSSIINKPTIITIDLYNDYLKLLYKLEKYELLIQESEKCFNLYGDNKAVSLMCKSYNTIYMINNSLHSKHKFIIQDILKSALFECDVDINLTECIFSYESNNVKEAKENLEKVLKVEPELSLGWVLLSRCNRKLLLIRDGLRDAERALEMLSKSKRFKDVAVETKILLLDLLSCSVVETDWLKAINLCSEIRDWKLNSTCLKSAIRLYTNLNRTADARDLLEDAKTLDGFNLLLAQLLRKEDDGSGASEVLARCDETDWEVLLEIGTARCDAGNFDDAIIYLLKAAKLNPNSPMCFYRLGLYYRRFKDDGKARRCLEKAFNLDDRWADCAKELNMIYKLQKNWAGSVAILQKFTHGRPTSENLWAWIQLGLALSERGDYSEAINVLRVVIRLDPNNSSSWETIGDAYMARGAYTSSIKSYQRALEVSPGLLYPQIRIANIQQLLGQYLEAKLQYKSVLDSNKLYIPALKGLGETCLGESRDYNGRLLWGRARDSAQDAVDYLSLAVKQHNKLSCIWKLLADSMYLVTKLPERYCFLSIDSNLIEGNAPGETNRDLFEKEKLFEFSIRCYSKAIVLTGDNILIWHDLAKCLLSYAQCADDDAKSSALYDKVFAAVHHCITDNPSNWTHWNLMGVLSFFRKPKNFSLAQHSFIKATTLEKNCSTAWCNLGSLYLYLNEIKLANEAFSQAQRCNPNYINSWVGQALIAELLNHEDCMDLFRHSTQLGSHPQSQIGYAHWVCRTLLEDSREMWKYSIENMHAIPVACDALTWYTELYPNDACAWNNLGLLQERMRLNGSSLKSFKHSLVLTKPGDDARDRVLVNYGRCLVKAGRYGDAVDALGRVANATFNTGATLALALYKDERYRESYDSYESALHWLTENERLQSDLLVALASMAYLFQGPDEVKTLLFQSIKLESPSPWGFYATLSFGLLHGDVNLAGLVLNEMTWMRDKKECVGNYAILTSFFYLLKGETKQAIRAVSKLLHRHPSEASLWLSLSMLLIRLHEHRPKDYAAAKCARIAMDLGQTNMDVTNVLCLASLGLLLSGNVESALKVAQKAIHCYPNTMQCWAILVSALRATSNRVRRAETIAEKIISHVKSLRPPDYFMTWINNLT